MKKVVICAITTWLKNMDKALDEVFEQCKNYISDGSEDSPSE